MAQLPRAPPVPSSRARVRASCKVSLAVLVLAGPLLVRAATPCRPTPGAGALAASGLPRLGHRGAAVSTLLRLGSLSLGDASRRAVRSSVGRPRGKEWRSLPAAVEPVLLRTEPPAPVTASDDTGLSDIFVASSGSALSQNSQIPEPQTPAVMNA